MVLLKDIEQLKISKTEEEIINLLNDGRNDINAISKTLNILLPTIVIAIRKLENKNIIKEEDGIYYLLDFGIKIVNFNKFRNNTLYKFCIFNNIDINVYNDFINNKKYNNMNLLLGINNLLKKETKY